MSETKEWVCITDVENVPLREGRSVHVVGHSIAIFNLGDRFLAVENRCPHRGGPLADGILAEGAVVCPLHAWKVDLATGSVTNRPDHAGCVETFPTRVEGGLIFLELSVRSSLEEIAHNRCLGSLPQDSLGRIAGEV
jgi:nitrite reductase (NADH) small subunit